MSSTNYDPTRDPHLATWRERKQMGITRMKCPSCGAQGYKPYIFPDGTIVAEDCGRCDHESSCGYHKSPAEWFKENGDNRREHENKSYTPPPPPPSVRLPSAMVRQFYCREPGAASNPLLQFWTALFDGVRAEHRGVADEMKRRFTETLRRFAVGTMPGGYTIWWVVDETGWIRSGKAMKYLSNGHRDKQSPNNFRWMHTIARLWDSTLDPECEYVGCLFGLHQLKDHPKEVCIVESEKTAVMMSVFRPDLCWLATMGLGNLNAHNLHPLTSRDIAVTLFPDYDAHDKWVARAEEIRKQCPRAKISISDYVRKTWFVGDSPQADILDMMERDYKLLYYS